MFLFTLLLIYTTAASDPSLPGPLLHLLAPYLEAGEGWSISAAVKNPLGAFEPFGSLGPYVLRIPASNNKLLSTTGALGLLGPNFQFSTTVSGWTDGWTSTNGLHQRGDSLVCVRGGGDPSLSWTTLSQVVVKAASTLRHLDNGSSAISLRFDCSCFGEPASASACRSLPNTWERGDLPWYYGAPPSVLGVDEGTVTLSLAAGDRAGDPVRVLANGSLTLDTSDLATVAASSSCTAAIDIAAFSGGDDLALSGSLCASSGVTNVTVAAVSPFRSLQDRLAPLLSLPQRVRPSFGACPADSAPAFSTTIVSDPLVDLVNHTLLVSDNYYAELIAKAVASSPTATSPPRSSTPIYEEALATIKTFLSEKYGVDPNYFFQTDGSGLSRHNLVAVDALLSLVKAHAAFSPYYFDLLPVGCVSGTLADRFCGTPGAGLVHAKTGTETGVDSLTGVVFDAPSSAGGEPVIAFSIIVNGSARRAEEVRNTIDQVVTYIIEATMSRAG